MKSTTFYEVTHNGCKVGKNSVYSFGTANEALKMIMAFKKDPKTHNENMSDESEAYWKNQTYAIVRVTIQTKTITSV